MSFRENGYCQLKIDDSVLNLTAREKKFLYNSWATVFANEIFPA